MANPPLEGAKAPGLNREDILRLVGDVDDATIVEILSTGATYAEIEQALKWVGAAAEVPGLDSEGLTPKAELVCDILLSDPAFADEE